MEELYSIMRDFLEVEYNQESLLRLLRAAEAAYSNEKQEGAKYLANCTKYYLKALQEELQRGLNRLDSYIAEEVKKR